jgi:hypothetical protein
VQMHISTQRAERTVCMTPSEATIPVRATWMALVAQQADGTWRPSLLWAHWLLCALLWAVPLARSWSPSPQPAGCRPAVLMRAAVLPPRWRTLWLSQELAQQLTPRWWLGTTSVVLLSSSRLHLKRSLTAALAAAAY